MSKKRTVQLVLLILTLAFIWGNSLLSIDASSEESEQITGLLRPILEWIFGEGSVPDDHPVRKAAHFLEFAALGVQLLQFLPCAGFRRAALAADFSFLAAFTDESIQLLSDRGDQIADVWIDLAGAVCGILFAAACAAWLRRRRRKKAEKQGKNTV